MSRWLPETTGGRSGFFPARREPKWVEEFGYLRTYPAGYDIDQLGTFGHDRSRKTRAEPGEAVH